MNNGRTYLDWNATAPLCAEARAACIAALDLVGNPSSPHAEGRRARALIEDAREQVAALVGASPAQVVFTSGGTEANNTVMRGGWNMIFVSPVEHDSVLAPVGASGAHIVELRVDRHGAVDASEAADALARAPVSDAALLSLQLANNETGVVQPVASVAEAAKSQGVSVHSDAIQAAGRVSIDVEALGVDYLTLSGHKIGGPKGTGALIIGKDAGLPAYIAGGGQERRRRAGTENVVGIAGFGAAAEAARHSLAGVGRLRQLRDSLEARMREITPAAVVIAAEAERLPNTACIALPGARAETLVIALDLQGIAVSAGAACSSGKVGTSHVLVAMGLAPELARAAIRISLGPDTSERDIAAFLEAWASVATRTLERAVA